MSKQLAEYLRYALDWIDAIPKETAASFPAMPGFDRDAAESALDDFLRSEKRRAA
jgi:hypothetical protein